MEYEEFVSQVRRYGTFEVLSACGKISATDSIDRLSDSGEPPSYSSHVIAGIAYASVVFGNPYRRGALSQNKFNQLVNSFNDLWDPFLEDGDLASLLVRKAYQQFPYQESIFWDLARTRALLHTAAEDADQSLITPSFWQKALGCSLNELVGMAILLLVAARKNGGHFTVDWMKGDEFEKVFKEIDRDTIERVFRDHFLLTDKEYKGMAKECLISKRGLEQISQNPILAGPYIQVGNNIPVAPVAKAIPLRATPGSLFFTGMKAANEEYSRSMGIVFEKYIEMQVRSFEAEQLIPNLEYERGKLAVDLILVQGDSVLLIEVKATSLTYGSKIGGESMQEDYDRAPGKAVEQIETTAKLIRSRHPGFSAIPNAKRILGLVVTLEPYHIFGSEDIWPNRKGEVPKWLISAKDLEQFVAIKGKAFEVILKELEALGGQSKPFADFLSDNQVGRNRILDSAWGQYPFSSQKPNQPLQTDRAARGC